MQWTYIYTSSVDEGHGPESELDEQEEEQERGLQHDSHLWTENREVSLHMSSVRA